MLGWIRNALCHRHLPAVLAVLSVLLLWPALDGGFQLDDHFQRFRLLGLGGPAIQLFVFSDGTPEQAAIGRQYGWLPWWAADDLKHANLRYLSVLTMQLDYLLWPDSAWLQHLHSLAWLGLLAFFASLFYRGVMGPTWAAGLAALLYAIDDAHALPAAYLANRNALIATALGVASLVCFQRARADGWRPGAYLSPLFLGLALTAGEMALSTAAWLFVFALVLDRGSAGERIRALRPNGAVLLAWLAAYRLGGFGSQGSGFYRDPFGEPLGFASGLLERFAALITGQWTVIASDFSLSAADADWFGTASLISTALVVAFVLPVVVRDRLGRFFGLGTLLSLFPVAATGAQNRLLFFVGLGSMGLFAAVLHALVRDRRERGFPIWWKAPAWVLVVLMLVFHVAAAPLVGLEFIRWHGDVASRMRAAIASVPHDDAIAEQTLVLLNPPDHIYTVAAIPVVKATAGLPLPKRMRALSAGSSPVYVTRVDDRSLRLDIERGLFPEAISRYYRSAALRYRVGERVEVPGMQVDILGLNADGDPDALLYTFGVPLEDDSLRWICWNLERAYEACAPPKLGEALHLPATGTLFDSRT